MGQKILSFGVGIHRGVLSLELSHVYTTKIEESYNYMDLYMYTLLTCALLFIVCSDGGEVWCQGFGVVCCGG